MQGEALGGASRIFGLERFPSTQRRKERKERWREGEAGGGKKGNRREVPFHWGRDTQGFEIQPDLEGPGGTAG